VNRAVLSSVLHSLSIVILFENSAGKIDRLLFKKKLHIEGVTPLFSSSSPLLEAPRPALSIPCYNTQVNAIMQSL